MNNCCNTKINFPSDKFKDCCEVVFSNCIAYTGPEGCLDFGTYPNLNEVIGIILDHICQSGNVAAVSAACLSEKGYNITDVTTFTNAVSDVICQILGCQVPAAGAQAGTITSLCDLNSRLDTQAVIACFQPVAHLGAQASLEQLLQAIQSTLCLLVNAAPVTDQYVKCSSTDTTSGYLSQKLQSGNTVILTTVNAGANEYLKPEIKIDPASTITWSIGPNGLKLTAGTLMDQYVKNSASDTTAGYLTQKLQSGNTVTFTTINPSGNEYLKPEIKIDPASTIPWSAGPDGLKLLCCPPPPSTDAAINCSGIETSGTVSSDAQITGVSIAVPYTCTVPGAYPAMVIPSNETVGSSPVAYASVAAGNFTAPGGSLVFNVTGNTTGYGGSTLSFTITVNGSSCLVTIRMVVHTAFTVPCDSSTWSLTANPLVVGTPVSAVSGPPYLSFQVNVTALGTPNSVSIGTVTAEGLTFTGNNNYVLSMGTNTVHLIISGTPTATTITVPITVNGTVYCQLTLTAVPKDTPTGSYSLQCTNCDGTNVLPAGTDGVPYNATFHFCYTNGVNGPVPAVTVTGLWFGTSIASGLTLTILAGTITSATGTLPGTISGLPTGAGTVVFNIPNTKCSLSVSITGKDFKVTVESTARPTIGSTNNQLIVSPSASLVDANGDTIVFDQERLANYAGYPGYYIADTRQLGYDDASITSVQPVSLKYTDSQAPDYGGYITGVNVDYIDDRGEVFSTQNFTPADFYNNADPYTVNGAVRYAASMINLTVPANTAKVKIMLQTP